MDKFQKIDQYVNGGMSRQEQLLFEEEIAKNKDLASAVKIYREIEAEMRQDKKYDEQEILLRKKLAEMNVRYFKTDDNLPAEELQFVKPTKVHTSVSHSRISKATLVRLAVAATIAGIIAFGIMYFIEKDNTSVVSINNSANDPLNKYISDDTSLLHTKHPANNVAEQNGEKDQKDQKDKDTRRNKPVKISAATLYADNFIPDNAPADRDGPLGDAFAYYENKKYAEAVAAINAADIATIVTRGEEGDHKLNAFYASYYKGLSYMAGKDFFKAIPTLENAIGLSGEGIFQIKAQWYLALAYVKSGELKRADELLKQIAFSKQPVAYKIKAQKLIHALEEIN